MTTGDPEDIRAWQRLDGVVTTSGRLAEADVGRLAAIGVRHVINLALEDHPEALADEASKMNAAGIRYTHIPVPFDAPAETHLDQLRDALRPGEPTHVHCIMNWRVSAFFYRLHREAGMDGTQARALMHMQWAPERSEDPRATIWAAFIARAD